MSCGRRSLRTVVQNPTEIAFFSRTRSIRSECIAEANRHCPQKAAVLPWCVVLLPVVYGYLWGWQVAFTHAAVNIVCSLTLARVLLMGYRNLPFTCSYPPIPQSAILLAQLCGLGYVVFVVITSTLESWAPAQPWNWIPLAAMIAAPWCVVWVRRATLRTLIDGSCLMRGRHLASSGSIWGNGHSLPNFPLIGDNSPYHSQSALRD
jgi:hypothetical protein